MVQIEWNGGFYHFQQSSFYNTLENPNECVSSKISPIVLPGSFNDDIALYEKLLLGV
jgi:hypothetical protein